MGFVSPGIFLEVVRHCSELWTTLGRSIFLLWALRKCSWHSKDSPPMLDPPPIIEFLKLCTCLVRIKGLTIFYLVKVNLPEPEGEASNARVDIYIAIYFDNFVVTVIYPTFWLSPTLEHRRHHWKLRFQQNQLALCSSLLSDWAFIQLAAGRDLLTFWA